ncbi:MAG: hypothetical protein ACFFDW_11755 [Candidatus Thorarchaeota archaeon]
MSETKSTNISLIVILVLAVVLMIPFLFRFDSFQEYFRMAKIVIIVISCLGGTILFGIGIFVLQRKMKQKGVSKKEESGEPPEEENIKIDRDKSVMEEKKIQLKNSNELELPKEKITLKNVVVYESDLQSGLEELNKKFNS